MVEWSDKRSALAISVLSSFFTPFMASSVNVALPSISSEFSMSAFLLSWVATSYLLSAAIFLVPFGRIADIKGRKAVFLAGTWIFIVSSVLCAVAPDALLLIVFRVAQGIGSGMIFGTSIAILTSVYPPSERGKVIGIATAVVYIGLSIGPFVGGVLTTNLGWRSLFLVLLPLGAAILYIGHIKLKGEWAEAKGERFDLAGSVVYALALSLFIIGFSLLPQTIVSPVIAWELTTGGVAGILFFVLLELRTRSPVLDMRLFRSNRAFAFSNIAALINYAATFAVGFLMSLYLQYILGMDPQGTGLILVSQPIVMAVFSPLAGKHSDTIEPRLLATVGMAISAVGLLFFAMLTEGTGIPLIVGCLAFIGFGFALFSSPNTNAIMGSVERKQYGIASASVGTMRLIGQVLSMGIASVCISLFLGPSQVTPALHHEFLQGFQLAFYVFAIMCFVGVFASFYRGNVRKEN